MLVVLLAAEALKRLTFEAHAVATFHELVVLLFALPANCIYTTACDSSTECSN